MAVLKRGLVVGGAALAGILLLAGIASAATDGGGGGDGGQDPYSPEACAAYRAQRTGLINARNQIQSDLNQINNQMNEATQNGTNEDQLAQLIAARQTVLGALDDVNRRIADLDDLIAGCE